MEAAEGLGKQPVLLLRGGGLEPTPSSISNIVRKAEALWPLQESSLGF
jgi:hypothetical protein